MRHVFVIKCHTPTTYCQIQYLTRYIPCQSVTLEKQLATAIYIVIYGYQVNGIMSGQFDRHPFLLTSADVAVALNTDIENGLTSAQVAQLQHEHPANELDVDGSIPWQNILAKQLFNAMILGIGPRIRSLPPSLSCASKEIGLTVMFRSPGLRDNRLLRHQRLD